MGREVNGKKKWEIEFEDFKSGKMENEIKELKSQQEKLEEVERSSKNKSEYKEKEKEKEKEIADKKEQIAEKEKKLKGIEKNSKQIENILKFKKDLIKNTKELLDKKKLIEKDEKDKDSLGKKMDELDKKREEAVKKVKEIEGKLKNPNLKEEDKQKLEAEKQDKLKDIKANDLVYSDIATKREKIGVKLESSNKDKIEKALLKNEKLIGKCDMIGANLVKGKSMEEIKPSLQNFKFTHNEDFAKKIEEMSKAEKEEKPEKGEEEPEKGEEEPEKGEEEPEKGEEEPEKGEENKPAKLNAWNKFLQKHPKIATVVNAAKDGISKGADKVKSLFTRKDNEKIDDGKKPEEAKKPEEEKKLNEENSDKEFIDVMSKLDRMDEDKVLTGITEKGTNGFLEGLKVEARKEAGLPEKSGMRQALLEQDKIANGGVKSQEENNDEGR